MTLDDIAAAASGAHLAPMGGFHDDDTTTVLLGPLDPGFWGYVTAHPEFKGKDPLDRWSEWAVAGLAREMGAEAFFPFGGPPYHPFIAWALRSGEAWQSPAGPLVHKSAGMLISYRGALRFDRVIALPAPALNPCDTCEGQPCRTTCPVDALSLENGYDVARCKAHIDVDAGCRAACRARMACPISQAYPRDPEQTAFHMEAFHPS